MKLSKAKSKKLRNQLPNNWSELIQERLKSKGHVVSESYIRLVIYGQRWSQEIIEEAIKLKEEHQAYIQELKNRI